MNSSLSAGPASPTIGKSRGQLRLLTVVCLVYMAVVMGAWLMLQWADQWWPATMLMFAPRWIFALPLGLLLPLTGILRSRLVVVVLMTGLIVGWPLMGFNIPWKQLASGKPTGTPFRVMTVNMHYSKADTGPLDELIATTAPDIVAIQEWYGFNRTALCSTPGWHLHANPGQFLASRHPIKKVVELGKDSMGEHASVNQYEIETSDGVFHVFSLHAATTRDGIFDTIHDKRNGPDEIRANSSLRRTQSAFVVEKATECKGPLMIVGDFNTPCESAIFADVWSGYSDAFTTGGWGLGYTFIGSKTTVRIDHILFRKGWVCTGCRVGPFIGSPHRPVIAELVWRGE